jgi:hypothetical protein
VLNRLLSGLIGFDRPSPADNEHRPGTREPCYETLEGFQADLLAIRLEPTEVTRWMRVKHLLWQGLFSYAALSCALLPLVLFLQPAGMFPSSHPPGVIEIVGLVVLFLFLSLAPAYALRGGLSFSLAGIAVVRRDGRRAARFRCIWRALLAWGVVVLLVGLTTVGLAVTAEWLWLGLGLVGMALVIFARYLFLILNNPARAPHDVVAETYLVPR